MTNQTPIVFENKEFSLVLGADCVPQKLVHKASGQDCLAQTRVPLFSITEDRPFNNEIKLIYPNKRTVFGANRVRMEDGRLIVGFDRILFEAIVEVKITEKYMAFTLVDFILPEGSFGDLTMTPPPVAEFRLLQLAVKERENFGEWLNVSWDSDVAVNVLATSPHARIDFEAHGDGRILTADAVRGIKLKGCSAALIISSPDTLLDSIEAIEEDYNLPHGVRARRGEMINASSYWVRDLNPQTVDAHIAYAKQAGIRLMLIYYKSFFKEVHGYRYCGDYDYNDLYPNGVEDLRMVLQKLKDAGIRPGVHFLHSHIGLLSSYVTPVADPRLNHTMRFTLAKPLGTDDTEIFVEESPEWATTHPACRVLQFNGELIGYEGYTTERPYRFYGCDRGHYDTIVRTHEKGTVGGLLDLSEFGATSIYIDQNTDLQDEVADKLASAYSAGFEFVYFDGSEGTNPPFDFHIPNAQYRVYRKLNPEPLFCEGAAKSHFGWHMLSGGNAFDLDHPLHVPTADRLKPMVAKFPLPAAAHIAKDFTRLNFGWFLFFEDTQPDYYEYTSSRAASYDCPLIVKGDLKTMANNPRTKDVFEVLNRWEDVRKRNWLTQEQKIQLRNPDQEHILLVNQSGEYELLPYREVPCTGNISAFLFQRNGKTCAVYWDKKGESTLVLPLKDEEVLCTETPDGTPVEATKTDRGIAFPASGRRYLETSLSEEALEQAFAKATVC